MLNIHRATLSKRAVPTTPAIRVDQPGAPTTRHKPGHPRLLQHSNSTTVPELIVFTRTPTGRVGPQFVGIVLQPLPKRHKAHCDPNK